MPDALMTETGLERQTRHLTPALTWDTGLVATRAQGATVETADGRQWLDFASGTATTNIGHCPPRVVAAARAQLERLIHSGGVFHYDSLGALCEALASVTPPGLDMFFFGNSGAEAIEGSIKLARYVTGRPALIAFRGAFHGRTLGCLSLTTSNAKYRRHYEPLVPSVYFAPYPDPFRPPLGGDPATIDERALAFLERMFTREVPPDQVAAIVVEPVQGEGGYVPGSARFLRGLREMATRHGIMLVFDEIQSGVGRTCRWWAADHAGVVPDIMAIAKGIASGFPLSAVVSRREVMERWAPGAHGTTFGGNPVSCAAAVATIETIRDERLLERAAPLAGRALARLRRLGDRVAAIGDVRGLGYMIGIDFVRPGTTEPDGGMANLVRQACQERGLILITCGPDGNILRFLPPLVTSEDELSRGIDIFEEAVSCVAHAS